jgi:hypothetical protein
MRIILKIGIALLCCALIGCASESAQKNVGTGLKWTTAELEGSTWQLIDADRIENMSFYPNGYLPITLGIKLPTGSTIMAPIFYWHIDSDGALVIVDNKKRTYEKLYKVEADDRRVTVQRDGKIQVYDKLTSK